MAENPRKLDSHQEQIPVLSIVIVTTNGLDFSIGVIRSIFESQPEISFEIILVDNASDEPVTQKIQDLFPKVKCLRVTQRQGFARNYNFGMKKASGTYLLILNDDMLVLPGALDALYHAITNGSRIGMVGGKLLSPDGNIQPDCARSFPTAIRYCIDLLFFEPGLPLGKAYYRFLQRRFQNRKTQSVPCIVGACMMSSREILNEVGYLDEMFDFYYEDVEWCHRIHESGYQVVFVSEAEIIHFGDRTMSKLREWGQKNQYLGVQRYLHRYQNRWAGNLWLVWVVTISTFLLRGLVFKILEVFGDQRSYSNIYFRLFKWILNQHPASQPVKQKLDAAPQWTN